MFSRKGKHYAKIGSLSVLAWVAAGILLFPIYMMVLISFKPEQQMLVLPPVFIFQPVTYHYVNVLFETHFLKWLVNSLVVSIGVGSVTLGIGLLGAYSLTRFKYFGRNTIAVSIIFIYLFPPVLLAVPLYVLMSRLGLANTLVGLAICYLSFTLPFCLFFLRGYFTTLPVEIEEQALVDGCSRVQALIRVVVPIAAPGIAAAFLFSFSNAWQEYLYALILLNNVEKLTLTVGLSQYTWAAIVGAGRASWGDAMAASFMTGLPVAIAFLFLQKYLVTGLAAGAVKG